MAVTATRAVWERSTATGSTRLVLLALADHVNEQRVQAGYPGEAWPSQRTLARLCNCSRSAVQEALGRLLELGEIADTGERRPRGTIVWEILPDLDWTADRSSETGEVTTGPESGHVTGRFSETTGPDSDATGPLPAPEPEVELEEQKNQKVEQGRSPAAPDVSTTSSPPHSNSNNNGPTLADDQATEQQHVEGTAYAADQAEELAELRKQLPGTTGNLRAATERCIADLEAELGDGAELADQAGIELREATA